jgi:hypothetical protein
MRASDPANEVAFAHGKVVSIKFHNAAVGGDFADPGRANMPVTAADLDAIALQQSVVSR